MVNRWRLESTFNKESLQYKTSDKEQLGHKGSIDYYEYNTYGRLRNFRNWDDVWALAIL